MQTWVTLIRKKWISNLVKVTKTNLNTKMPYGSDSRLCTLQLSTPPAGGTLPHPTQTKSGPFLTPASDHQMKYADT